MALIAQILVISDSSAWWTTAKEGFLWVYDKISAFVHAAWEIFSTYSPMIKEHGLATCLFLKKWAILSIDFIYQYVSTHPGEVKGALFTLSLVWIFIKLKNLFHGRPSTSANAHTGNRSQ